MSEIEAKVRYVKLARSLKTYGVSFFLVKVESSPPVPPLMNQNSSPPAFYHLSCFQLLPLNPHCSSFPCISVTCLSLLPFPLHYHCIPLFMLFVISSHMSWL